MSKGRWIAGGCLGVTVLACGATGALFAVASNAVGALDGASVACSGQPVPGAAPYVSGGAQRVISFEHQASGGWAYAGTLLPHSFPDAEEASEATLVFCSEPSEREVIESCSYDGGTIVRRTAHSRRTRLVEAAAGRVVREIAVVGHAADACPESVAIGGGGGGVSVRVLGVPLATVGEDEVLPNERTQEGAEPAPIDVEAAFGDLVI